MRNDEEQRKRQEWLRGLKVGDEVRVEDRYSRGREVFMEKIARLTDARIYTDSGKVFAQELYQDKHFGVDGIQGYGKSSSYCIAYPHRAPEADEHEQLTKTLAALTANASTEALRGAVALLEADAVSEDVQHTAIEGIKK